MEYETPEPSLHESQVNEFNSKSKLFSPVEEEVKLKRYSSAIPGFSKNKIKSRKVKFGSKFERYRIRKHF